MLLVSWPCCQLDARVSCAWTEMWLYWKYLIEENHNIKPFKACQFCHFLKKNKNKGKKPTQLGL